MIDVDIQMGRTATHTAPRTLLGMNLDGCADTVAGLLSDRLENPRFLGPANPASGIAPGWSPTNPCLPDVRFSLTAGLSMSGGEAQWMQRIGAREGGLVQPGRTVRAGERLEVELWAKARHRPVRVRVGLRPGERSGDDYASALLVIDAAYWKPYRAVLEVASDDADAVFFCLLADEGEVWLDQVHLRPLGEGPLNRDMLGRLAALRPGSLRFPGSCLATVYRWRHGTGPHHLRPVLPDPVFHWALSYEFGTDEYLQVCLDAGIAPHLVIDIGCGTPDEAAAWATYCHAFFTSRGVRPPVAYFNIGNEEHGAWETSHMTGRMYAAALRAFVPGIREGYPGARIIAIGEPVSEGLRRGEETPWRQAVLEDAGAFADVLGVNVYSGRWQGSPEEAMSDVTRSIRQAAESLHALAGDVRTAGGRHAIALTEYNYWLHATHHEFQGRRFIEPADAQHALFVAGMLNMLLRFGPPLELACYYQLVNVMGMFQSRQGAVTGSSVSEVYALYGPALPGEVLPLTHRAPVAGPYAAVDGVCLRNASGTWLFLANLSPSDAATVRLEGCPAAGPSACVCLAAAAPSAELTEVPIAAADGRIVLPPLSVARLHG